MLGLVDTNQIFSHALVVVAYQAFYQFALLQSSIHEIWLRRQASTMRTDIRYTPSDCFQTFPFPLVVSETQSENASEHGQRYYESRKGFMLANSLGLTKAYNLFHDPKSTDSAISGMRRLHVEIDQAVLACYGWQDIDLAHGFYLNDRKKTRFMPSREAQREIFTRLLALNQEIAAQEAAAGMTPAAEPSDEEEEAGLNDE